jgi:hypothetical protein
MNTNAASLALTLCLASGAMRVAAEIPEHKCPVVIDQVELNYNHAVGRSVPQLRMRFGNEASERISTVTFSLSLLDSGGYPHSYPNDLKYSEGLETGKKKVFTWDLSLDSVDIHRAGEKVIVQKVEFADTQTWTDDGSESCVFTVDFHAR